MKLTCTCNCGDCSRARRLDNDCPYGTECDALVKVKETLMTNNNQEIPAKIEIDGVEYIVVNPTPPPTFEIGDYVKVKGTEEYGRVRCIEECEGTNIGVEFPRFDSSRHDLDGSIPHGHGWYYNLDELEKET